MGSQTRPGGRRGRRWDEQSIRDALAEFLAGRDRWPTYDEFVEGGAKGLRDVIMRVRGVRWWAHEMGLPGGERRPGGVHKWTEERIATTLTEFLADRSTWPTREEFKAAGLRGLREALAEHGGIAHWATRIGVKPPPKRRAPPPRKRRPGAAAPPPAQRRRPLWTEQRIETELARFLAGRTEWPRHREFVAAGHKQLYHAVLTHGGTHAWARRAGVRWVKRHGGAPAWTEQRVRADLQGFLKDRTIWPTGAEFSAAGRTGLLRALRRLGGSERWRNEFGLLRSVPARSRAARPRRETAHSNARRRRRSGRWEDADIEAAIAPLVSSLGRWPTKSEFQAAGLWNALAAVYGHGGREAWQRRLGVG